MTPLYIAAQIGHLEVVKALLEEGANKEAADKVSGGPRVARCVCLVCARCARYVG